MIKKCPYGEMKPCTVDIRSTVFSFATLRVHLIYRNCIALQGQKKCLRGVGGLMDRKDWITHKNPLIHFIYNCYQRSWKISLIW